MKLVSWITDSSAGPRTRTGRVRVATSSVDEALEERGRQVTLTGVGDDDDDRLAGELRASGHLTGGLQGTTAGDAGDDSLLGGSTTGKADGVLPAHQQNLVDDGLVEVVRHEARSPSLDLVGAFSPLVMTGDSAGSAPNTLTSAFFSLRYLPAPEMVPPVPMPATMASTAPSVSFQISSPVRS